VNENFAAAARQAPQARLLEPTKHVAQGQLVDLVEVPDFRRTEGVQIDLRKARLQVAEQLLIPLEPETGMQATLHKNLVATQGNRFLDLLVQNFARQHVGVRIVAFAIESADVTHSRT